MSLCEERAGERWRTKSGEKFGLKILCCPPADALVEQVCRCEARKSEKTSWVSSAQSLDPASHHTKTTSLAWVSSSFPTRHSISRKPPATAVQTSGDQGEEPLLRRDSAAATWSWIVFKLVAGVVWTHALYNHLWAEIIFFERPLHVHIHCLEVIVVVVVSVVIVVVVVIVVDVVVYVHDGVDGNENKGKEGKGIEAGLRRTTGGRSRLWGPATCPCCWQTLGGGDRQGGGGEQRFQIMEVGQVWREVHDGHREICAGGRWHNTQVKARITVFRRYQSQAGENCFWRLHRYISKLFCLLVSLKAIKMLYMSLWNISILSVKSWSPVVSRMSLSRWKCSHLVFPPKTTVNVTKIIL